MESFKVSSHEGFYSLIRIKPDPEEQNAALLKYKKTYDLLFNNIEDGLLTVNLSGRILTANPAFFRLLEYEKTDEKLLNDISSIYVYKDALEEKIIQLLGSQTIFNLETHLYTKNGVIKRVLDSSWAIKSPKGIVTGYSTQFKDITYLKNIESKLMISERNFTILFDTILSSIIIVDIDGHILNFNSAAEKIYGYTWEEIVGERFDSIFRTDKKRPSLTKIMGLVDDNNGKYVETEVKRICKNSSVKYTYAAYTAVKNTSNEIIAYSIVEKDLTERVKLERKLKESFDEIKETQSAAILGFAKLTEYRDKDTGKHLERIREYTRVMANILRKLPEYNDYITDEYIEDLSLSSILHDVGKVGIEDYILLKDGKLSSDEYKRIKDHSVMGGDALSSVEKKLNKESFLTLGKEVAYYHHEKWDGTGYPEGKKGAEIPLSARIVALADVYDALTSKRPYKDAYPHKDAVEIIKKEKGKQFDPDIVDVFLENHEVFLKIKMFVNFEENPETITDIIADSVLL